MRDDLKGTTGEFVAKLHDTQAKDEKNREHQGKGDPQKMLASKKHLNGG